MYYVFLVKQLSKNSMYTYVTTVSGCFVWTVIFLYTRLYTPVRGVLAHDRLNSQPKRLASLDTGIKLRTSSLFRFRLSQRGVGRSLPDWAFINALVHILKQEQIFLVSILIINFSQKYIFKVYAHSRDNLSRCHFCSHSFIAIRYIFF